MSYSCSWLLLIFVLKGTVCDPIELFIFNGTPAQIEEYPFLVSLRKSGQHFCGGIILDSNIVLTAGHCVPSINPADIEVMAGNSNQVEKSETQQILTVSLKILHPEYYNDRNRVNNDVAILLTTKEFKWRRQVQPARIAPDWAYQEDIRVSAVGWGRTEEGILPDTLFKVTLSTASDSRCQKEYRLSYDPRSTFCIYSPKKDTCKGDSGGPVTNEFGELVGVVSYGSTNCGTKAFVASKVTVYLNWIEEQMKMLKEEKRGHVDLSSVGSVDQRDYYKAIRELQSAELQVQDVCGSNWKLRCLNGNCNCYALFHSLTTWHEAKLKCQRYGGELASIMNSEENDLIGEYIRSRYTQMWIGLNDLLKEGNFVWQNGGSPTYLNWMTTEPNDYLGAEDCVSMTLHMTWNDVKCDDKYETVCKVSVFGRSKEHRCSLGWAFYENNCYQLHSPRLTWEDALKRCQQKGANLVSIHNEAEKNFVNGLMEDFDDDNVWIGINDIRSEGIFEWSDGTSFDFVTWDPLWGQPNNYGNEDCGLIHKDSGKWHDYACHFKFPSVCKKLAVVL